MVISAHDNSFLAGPPEVLEHEYNFTLQKLNLPYTDKCLTDVNVRELSLTFNLQRSGDLYRIVPFRIDLEKCHSLILKTLRKYGQLLNMHNCCNSPDASKTSINEPCIYYIYI